MSAGEAGGGARGSGGWGGSGDRAHAALRHDLLELGPDALRALANPGFVRRARKDLDAGRVPELSVERDGGGAGTAASDAAAGGGADITITARFDDGTVTRLPSGMAIRDAQCTCPASGWCRHRVTLVMAYQDQYGNGATPAVPEAAKHPHPAVLTATPETGANASGTASLAAWTPGDFSDDAIEAAVGPRVIARAAQASVAVRLSAPAGVPTARLPLNVVQFFSSTTLAHARCDCRAGGTCEHLVVAIWAFRRAGADADSSMPGELAVDVGPATRSESLAADIVRMRDNVSRVCRDIMVVGVGNIDHVISTRLERVTEQARRLGWRWVVADLEELARQLHAYEARSSAADPIRMCIVLAESPARLAAALAALRGDPTGPKVTGTGSLDAPGASAQHDASEVTESRSRPRDVSPTVEEILGIGVPETSELAHLRLVSLGARVWSSPAEVGVQVFVLDPDTNEISVVEQAWDGSRPLHDRRLLGVPVARAAASQIVTSAAKRGAFGVLEIARDRRRTLVTPVSSAGWPGLPVVTDAPPAFLRARHRGDGVAIVDVEHVAQWGWDAATQQLTALLETAQGEVLMEVQHSQAAPGAVDAVAQLLAEPPDEHETPHEHPAPHAGLGADGRPGITRIAGFVEFRAGLTVIEPLAIASGPAVIVPATAPPTGQPLPAARAVPVSPQAQLIAEVFAEVSSWIHEGITNQRRTSVEKLVSWSQRLSDAGLTATASLVREVARRAPEDPSEAADHLIQTTLLLASLHPRVK